MLKKRTIPHYWFKAKEYSLQIIDSLQTFSEVKKVSSVGSLRRCVEVVNNINLIVVLSDSNTRSMVRVAHFLEELKGSTWVKSVNPIKSDSLTVETEYGIDVEIEVVTRDHYFFALHYYTGSLAYTMEIQERAKELGVSFNIEEPSFLESEEELFHQLSLQFIPPELREGRGEIEVAAMGKLPELIQFQDIKGVFHNHTTASDGRHTLEEMAQAAQAHGWDYLGIADHSQSAIQLNGLSEERLLDQIEQIRTLNQSGKYKVHLFSGTECEILVDGTLDYPNELLEKLDYVVVSVHGELDLDKETMTKRVIRALENPHTTMLGHITGRLLLRRAPYSIDIERVIDCAIANEKIIELNASPARLEMDWRLWHRAKSKGLMCSINTDAHHIEHFNYYKLGVNSARKGGLEKQDVLNTYPLYEVKSLLGGEVRSLSKE